MANETKQQIFLHSWYAPALVAGKYTIDVSQTVNTKKTGQKQAFQKPPLTFHVETSPYSLPPSDIYDRYPPANAKGSFAETFPHIVLSRRTLPWERKAENDDKDSRPWLALLLLNEDEFGHQAKDGCALETCKVPGGDEHDQCLKLSIPADQFKDIAPSWDDLRYLAHVRQVRLTKQMDSAGIDDKDSGGSAWFAVVVCNRLPTPNKMNHVFLVSLEGQKASLPGQSPPANKQKIDLVVLAKWQFIAEPEGTSVGDLLQGLEKNCALFRASSTNGNTAIQSALESGYIPLTHETRQGSPIVSWYRGPFAPLFLPTEPRNRVYMCADAALRYDESQGLFDVSYAAAWQLGRLLGLQNQAFAKAVYGLKLRAVQESALTELRKSIQERFGLSNSKQVPGNWEEWQHSIEKLFNKTKSADESKESSYQGSFGQELQIPAEIRQWLGRLFLLHGVPLEYLVPHPSLLPKESLRFFYLDTTWVAALMDGALSIGRTKQSHNYLDKAMAGDFLKDVCTDEIGTRTDMPGPKKGPEIIGHLTGFLLRSDLVLHWKGMEIRANDGTADISALRMERVTSDTMLAIYNGHLRNLVITQPAQGLHFGITKQCEEWEGKEKWRGKSVASPCGKRVLEVAEFADKKGRVDLALSLLQPTRLQLTVNINVQALQL